MVEAGRAQLPAPGRLPADPDDDAGYPGADLDVLSLARLAPPRGGDSLRPRLENHPGSGFTTSTCTAARELRARRR